MKALTVRQPHAWAIAHGFKPIENRSRLTHHRGPLVIHSGKEWDALGEAAVAEAVDIARSQGHKLSVPMREDAPWSSTGLVLAVVDVVGVCTESRHAPSVVCDCGPWARPWATHWQLANVRRLAEPFPARGHEYMWEIDFELNFEKEPQP
jgi:hypothetical protein